MPNISAHMAVAKKVGEILNINDDEYIFGNLLPDLYTNKRESHFKKRGKIYMIPNIDYYIETHDISNKLNLGYLVHLLLDKYYLEDYLAVKFPNAYVFDNNIIYNDYDVLNKDIIKAFDLDVAYIENILTNHDGDFDKQKLALNIKCLHFNVEKETIFLKKEEFIKFLNDVSQRIVDYIKKMDDVK